MAHPTYPITRSPLYRLPSRKALAKNLGVSADDLKSLQDDKNYRLGTVIKNGKPRPVQVPTGKLRHAHNQIQKLLKRLEPGKYLYSGRKGLSTLENAELHKKNPYCIKIDIKKFFPSSTNEAVFQFLLYQMKMPDDVARVLANVCTFNGHIPTGSPLSMNLAYWAYRPTFDRIAEIAKQSGYEFSLWVDDLVFSSTTKIPGQFPITIKGELKRAGLTLNQKKLKKYGKHQDKLITGIAISKDGKLQVPNKQRKAILKDLNTLTESNPSEKTTNSLMGRLASARRVEPELFDGLYKALKTRRPKSA